MEKLELNFCPKIITSKSDVTVLEINRLLEMSDLTIVDHKPYTLRGNVNDYHSDADYWWPNPDGSDKYVRKDGKSNTENFTAHRETLRKLRNRISILSLFASDYSFDTNRALENQVRRFFIDPQTRMTPHLNFSQGIHGRCSGRAAGLIDGIHFAEIAIALERWMCIHKTESSRPLLDWFNDYFIFLTGSVWGKSESARENNHATAYWLQVSALAFLLGKTNWLNDASIWLETKLYETQMSVDGFFPAELKRTKPLSYSIFQVNCLAAIHQILSIAGYENTWKFSTDDNRGFKKAYNAIAPFIYSPENWPFEKDVEYFRDWKIKHPLLYFGSCALGDFKYMECWDDLSNRLEPSEVDRNIPVTCFPLWNKNS